ncbi:threonine/serine dehydratase [Deinococcus deserti]|uniref:Putative threonine ammonia-lyase (L-threonine dehydratase) n=1 Tax=Deinococcus deserti (strain DSM 17065 / CIP 109153 / LMG 22923 / VCD115) TaxID=546414 RepID=C1D253_DEIDV|nr:threonine/serine dehydratase [Deinococcus deserti]ACO47492.1 putative threonine ammonia-lyase (L-threonine dehydratase) [Deinococcus deserti VCD115]
MNFQELSLSTLRDVHARLKPGVLRTPVWRWQTGAIPEQLTPETEVWLKLELFQKTGTFKLRGALNTIQALDAPARARGVTAVSAGNHAIAVAYAAREAGVSAKVVMLQHSSPARVQACEALGADVHLAPDVHQAFEWVQSIQTQEGRTMIHPFDGPLTSQGTAGVGLEFMDQVPHLDAVIVPVGGGGLISGVAAAVKQLQPQCQVYGVEPLGADSLSQSLSAGEPVRLERVTTIADSLGAPFALRYSFDVCRAFVDEVVRVSDDELCRAMFYLFRDMKLVTEPATAAGTAALLGPLKARLSGKRVGIVACGANVDVVSFHAFVTRGQLLLES